MLFTTARTPDQVLAELPRTFPGSRIFSGELTELLREVFTSPLIQVVPDQPVEYVVGHVGDYRLGLRQADGQVKVFHRHALGCYAATMFTSLPGTTTDFTSSLPSSH